MFTLGLGIRLQFYTSRYYTTTIKKYGFFRNFSDDSIVFVEGWCVDSNLKNLLVKKRCFVI